MYKNNAMHGIVVMLFSILFVTLLSFLLMRLSPIDPATAYVMRNSVIVTQEQIDEARDLLGMDQALPVQYILWLKNAASGDLGTSLATGEPVIVELSKSVPVSLTVAGISSLLMMFGIIIIGTAQYIWHDTFIGKVINMLCICGLSIPPFCLAIFFVSKVAMHSAAWSVVGNSGLMRFIPSAVCLSVAGVSFYSQMFFERLHEEMQADYIYYAHCRGLSDLRIIIFHAFPAAITDLVPNFAQMIGLCLTGAMIVERVFSLPGFGNLIINGVIQRDAPVIHASVLFLAIMLVLLNFVSSIIQNALSKAELSKERAA